MRMLAADIVAPEGTLRLGIESTARAYTFLVNDVPLCSADSSLLSSELAGDSFTGTMIGLYAIKDGAKAVFVSLSTMLELMRTFSSYEG